MTNPDREELVKLADEIEAATAKVALWPEKRCGGLPEGELGRVFMDFLTIRNLAADASTALRRLASSDSEPEPVAWIDFADSGNVRLWTSEKSRAAAEVASGRKMTPVYTAPPADAGMREASVVTCCVTGAIPGDGGACGDCDPCLLGETSVPSPVKRLIAEKNSLLHRIGELEDKLAEALTAPGATTKSDGASRPCTCHPDDNPPEPCPQKFAYTECVEATKPSDPSSTRSEVTVDVLAAFIGALDPDSDAVARALLDQFEIRRK